MCYSVLLKFLYMMRGGVAAGAVRGVLLPGQSGEGKEPSPSAGYGMRAPLLYTAFPVIPAKAGIPFFDELAHKADPRLRGGDDG